MPTDNRWYKGMPSPNPTGKNGALTQAQRHIGEVLRTLIEPEQIGHALLAIAAGMDPFEEMRNKKKKKAPDGLPTSALDASGAPDWTHRMMALKMFAEYAYGRPIQGHVVQGEIQQTTRHVDERRHIVELREVAARDPNARAAIRQLARAMLAPSGGLAEGAIGASLELGSQLLDGVSPRGPNHVDAIAVERPNDDAGAERAPALAHDIAGDRVVGGDVGRDDSSDAEIRHSPSASRSAAGVKSPGADRAGFVDMSERRVIGGALLGPTNARGVTPIEGAGSVRDGDRAASLPSFTSAGRTSNDERVDLHEPTVTPPGPGVNLQKKEIALSFPDSANVERAELDPATGIVRVTFRSPQGPRSYAFANFTPALMTEWQRAPSAGAWFARVVRSGGKAHPMVSSPVSRGPGVVL